MTDKIIFLVILLSLSLGAGLIAGKIMDSQYDDEEDPITDYTLSRYTEPAKAGEKDELLRRNS